MRSLLWSLEYTLMNTGFKEWKYKEPSPYFSWSAFSHIDLAILFSSLLNDLNSLFYSSPQVLTIDPTPSQPTIKSKFFEPFSVLIVPVLISTSITAVLKLISTPGQRAWNESSIDFIIPFHDPWYPCGSPWIGTSPSVNFILRYSLQCFMFKK